MIRASRGVRVTVALAALAGLLSATAFGAATTLHVLFEHQASHGASAHGHAHPHEAEHSAHPGHADPDDGQMHPVEPPGHTHAPLLAAELQARSGRLSAGLVSAGPAEAACGLADPAVRSPLRPASRASPPARAAPLARRSVVLQV